MIVLAKDSARTGRLAFYGSIREAREFFGCEKMEEIVKLVNRPSEGGAGMADAFIAKYMRCSMPEEKRQNPFRRIRMRYRGRFSQDPDLPREAAEDVPVPERLESTADVGHGGGLVGLVIRRLFPRPWRERADERSGGHLPLSLERLLQFHSGDLPGTGRDQAGSTGLRDAYPAPISRRI